MNKVEFTINENREAMFSRNARFFLAEAEPEADTPSQEELAQKFAEQAERFGWPVTFVEPITDTETGEPRYPVMRFFVRPNVGEVSYTVEDYLPGFSPEPELSGMADNSEVISPAPSKVKGDKPKS